MRNILLLTTTMLIMLLGSCKPGVPREYIQPRAMENILYDYHIALGMAQEQFQRDEDRIISEQAYKLAVLRKHNVSEEKFEASLEYYMRHTKELHGIYERLTERLEKEAVAQGVSEGELSQYESGVTTGDTANVWVGEKAMVLMKQPPYNHYSFVIKADTSFYKGDRFTMTFDSQYLVQDGSRDAVVVLAMRLNNDSIVTQYQHMMTNSRQTITISDGKRIGIKEIRGYLMIAPDAERSTTLKLLFLSNIKLTKIHAPEVANTSKEDDAREDEKPEKADSVDKNEAVAEKSSDNNDRNNGLGEKQKPQIPPLSERRRIKESKKQ